jgi:hypothetical protein
LDTIFFLIAFIVRVLFTYIIYYIYLLYIYTCIYLCKRRMYMYCTCIWCLYLRWEIRKWALRIWGLNPQSALFADLRIADFPTQVKNGCGFADWILIQFFCGFKDCGFPNAGRSILCTWCTYVKNVFSFFQLNLAFWWIIYFQFIYFIF